jgi:hypothetical protein
MIKKFLLILLLTVVLIPYSIFAAGQKDNFSPLSIGVGTQIFSAMCVADLHGMEFVGEVNPDLVPFPYDTSYECRANYLGYSWKVYLGVLRNQVVDLFMVIAFEVPNQEAYNYIQLWFDYFEDNHKCEGIYSRDDGDHIYEIFPHDGYVNMFMWSKRYMPDSGWEICLRKFKNPLYINF